MKRNIAALLALVMLVLSFCGCAAETQQPDQTQEQTTQEQTTQDTAMEDVNNSSLLTDGGSEDEMPREIINASTTSTKKDVVKYVMIYNPNIYSEQDKTKDKVLSTGNFSNQIDLDMVKASGLEQPEETFTSISQEDPFGDLPLDKIDISGNRATGAGKVYKQNSKQYFYHYNKDNTGRVNDQFVCLYAGTHCNVWTYGNNITQKQAKAYGKEFDSNIYSEANTTFGTGRFTDNGGKVNLLFYPMRDGLLGCFSIYDLFATGEATQAEITTYGLNTDHAIVHINSIYSGNSKLEKMVYGTMAHEYQHLICATDWFSTKNLTPCGTWINEAMSGYIEENLYEGSKKINGHYAALEESDLVRNGQSMYNFTTNEDDIGVYGSVYLFAEYLAMLAGEDVFYNFHYYWRNSYSDTMSDAEGLCSAVPSEFLDLVDGLVTYPSYITFDNQEEEWLSKLILSYHLDMLCYTEYTPEAFGYVDPQTLLYDQIGEANIEGGGRIILAVKDGVYRIPNDADRGLVYVGLNEDFQPITEYIFG